MLNLRVLIGFPLSYIRRIEIMRFLLWTALVLTFGSTVFAQETVIPLASLSTSVPSAARYEVLQPSLWPLAQRTFRLDKYSGQIFMLGSCPKDSKVGSPLCWREMEIIDLPKSPRDARPRFQMIQSATRRQMFLFNIDTGKTWQLGIEGFKEKDISEKWFPFLDDLDCRSNPVC